MKAYSMPRRDLLIGRSPPCVQQGLYIADEVQGGFGRTGHHWWSHQQHESVPDVVTLGKPMGNGHPLAGVIARRDLVEPFSATAMYFNTFAGNPVSCAVGMAVLDVIEQEGLMANAVSTGAHVKAGLDKLALASTAIGDVRQKGLFLGVELISDPATQAPDTRLAKQVVNQLKDRVLISSIGQHNNVLKSPTTALWSRARGHFTGRSGGGFVGN